MNNYLQYPVEYLISERLKQLSSYYGQKQVYGEVIYSDSTNPELRRHIDNLMLTYDTSLVLEVTEILFLKVG